VAIQDVYLRKKTRREAERARQSTYSVGGATYETKTGKLLEGRYVSPISGETVIRGKRVIDPTFTPTVLSDTNIRQNVIPDLQSRANNLYGTPSPYQTTPTGERVTTTGAPKAPTTGEVTGEPNAYDDIYKQFQGALGETPTAQEDPLDSEYNQLQEDVFKRMEQEVSEAAKRSEAGVLEAYSRRKRDLAILQGEAGAQKAGLGQFLFSSGASRYGTVGSTSSLVTSTERGLMNELNDLRFDEQEAINKVRDAQKDGDWRVMQARLDYAENVRAEKEKRRDEFNKAQREQNEKIAERRMEVERDLAVASVFNALGPDVAHGDILSFLNEEGIEITAEELAKSAKNIVGDVKSPVEQLTGESRNFFLLKEMGALPTNITSLPEDKQLFAYLGQNAAARRAPTGAGQTFSIAEVDKLGLPRSLVGVSEQTVFRQLQLPEAPNWFREQALTEMRRTPFTGSPDQFLATLWDDFRNEVLGAESNETNQTDFSAQEQRKLEQAGLSDAGRQEQLNFLYGKTPESKFVKDLRTALSSMADSGIDRATAEKQLKKKYGKELPETVANLLNELWPS
jgi:hypothetical protein